MHFHLPEIIKKHPVSAGAIVIGGGLAFVVFSGWFSGGGGGSSSGGTTLVTSGPSNAQVAAQAQAQQNAVALQAQQGNNDTQVAIAQLAAALQTHQSDNALSAVNTTTAGETNLGGRQIDAQVRAVEIGANTQVSLANIGAGTQITLANIDSRNQLGLASIYSDTTLGLAHTYANSQDHLVDVQGNLMSRLIDVITPRQTTTSGGFDPFNTVVASQPVLQGFDTLVAQEIDRGQVAVTPNGVTIAGEGTYSFNNPLDQRWANYTPGTYTRTGSISFGG